MADFRIGNDVLNQFDPARKPFGWTLGLLHATKVSGPGAGLQEAFPSYSEARIPKCGG